MLRGPRVKGTSQYSTCVYFTTYQSEMSPAVLCFLGTRNKAILVAVISTAEKCVRRSHDDKSGKINVSAHTLHSTLVVKK